MPRALGEAATDIVAPGPSLRAHVLGQVEHLVPGDADRRIALALIDAMAPNGFLHTMPDAVAATLRVPLARVETVLTALQQIEPRGLFARSLGECLILQIDEADRSSELLRVIDNLSLLTDGGQAALAKAAGVGVDELASLLTRLRAVNPRPAAGFSVEVAQTRIADLLFEATAQGWQVRLNPDSLPRLSVIDLPDTKACGTVLVRERQAAQRLLSAVEKRNENLLALGSLLAREQAEFLSAGRAGQRVLTRRETARQLGLHESTIGRLVGATSGAVPGLGVVPLGAFFTRAVRREQSGDGPGASAVMHRIERMIATENPDHPLYDGQIAALLGQEGLRVSRRVVARLRSCAGIPNRARRRSRPG